MNKNTPQEMIALIQAHMNGKQLQHWVGDSPNTDSGNWKNVIGEPLFNFARNTYRIKPTSKKVPLTQKDIPLDRPVWLQFSGRVEIVTSVRDTGIGTTHCWMPFDGLVRCNYYISFDGGKTWQKCEKEVAE